MSGIASARWWTKKVARAGVAAGGAAILPMLGSGRAYALTYHRVGHVPRDPFCVTPEDFEEQVRSLARQGRAVTLAQLEAHARGEVRLPANACLITIDDGMLSSFEHAVPILVRHGVPAVLYVSSSLIGRTLPDAEEPYMSWEQLREVSVLPGIVIGSHAHTHRSLGAMDPQCARSEIETSRCVLEDRLGREVRSFAYPFGTIGDFNQATEEALEAAGFTSAFTSIHGAIRPGMNPVRLPRIKVEGGEGTALFALLSRGATVPWQVVDRHLWRLQRVRAERT